MKLKSAEQYLKDLYTKVEPKYVVEIGADPQMLLPARIGANIPRIGILDFKSVNDYRSGWFDMHQKMGINVERVDGDARKLRSLVFNPDIIYSHCVLYSINEAQDIKKILSVRRGEIILSHDENRSLHDGFRKAEDEVIEQVCKVNAKGQVVWFTSGDVSNAFRAMASSTNRRLVMGSVLRMSGEDPNNLLVVCHLNPAS